MGVRTLRKRAAEPTASQEAPPKRKRQGTKDKLQDVESVDMLPHNLGPAPKAKKTSAQKHAKGSAPSVITKEEEDLEEIKARQDTKEEVLKSDGQSGNTSRRLRPRTPAAKSMYVDPEDSEKDTKKRAKVNTKSLVPAKKEPEDDIAKNLNDIPLQKSSQKTKKKTKANPYGLTPGITPFPDWPAPSEAACEEVYGLLAKVNGEGKAPDKIPAPSLEVSGCGEVPSVLDAMIRTRLSAHTTSKNSNAAFKGLVDKFGILKDGIGQGSVDWNKVRAAPVEDIVEAIKTGGLAQIKSKDIKAILQMVYEENQERRLAFLAEKETGTSANVVGAEEKTQGQKDLEILKTEQSILSLDHIHGMHPEEAMQALVKFPGIGVKTASCVILFCLQQPSFAVDTHVHRISGWLGWIPLNASRDEAFSHLEVRIPNHLKYGLHKLFVQHGKSCIRCRANTSEGTEGWHSADYPVEDVIERTGKQKGHGKSATPKKRISKDEDYSE